MIMIDILYPPTDEIYDFEADEDITGGDLLNDALKLMERKEGMSLPADLRELFFYRKGDFLNSSLTLKSQGLKDGDRLILL